MATIPLLSTTQELDENLRVIMRQLKSQLADGDLSFGIDIDADISDSQVERVRTMLFGGTPQFPREDNAERKDPDWVVRYNVAIAQGDQEKAIQILVDKEDRLTISWSNTTPIAVQKYIIHYKDDYTSTEYNGQGLSLSPNGTPMSSPFEVSRATYEEKEGLMSLGLYGDYEVPRQFAVQYVDYNNAVGPITPIYRNMTLAWGKPSLDNIEQYRITYSVNGQPGYGLFMTQNNQELDASFYIDKDAIEDPYNPMLNVYSQIINAFYGIDIVAIDNVGNIHPVTRISLDKQKKPCYNEYCEIIGGVDDATIFGDIDRVNAILWYLNYVFFLDNQNWWSAGRMVTERKLRNTVFPRTTPWFFQPVLKLGWERQESQDQYIDYLQQNLEIPLVRNQDPTKTIEERLKAKPYGYLDVYQNIIDQNVFLEISGVPGALDVYLSTATIDEEYHNINTIADLSLAMTNSEIGQIIIASGWELEPLKWTPFRTYSRDKMTITRNQENIFIFAYFGSEEATRGARGYTSLDFAPERRVRLENWQTEFAKWISIHENIFETWKAILTLNPLGLVLDTDNILRQNIKPETLHISPIEKPDSLPETVTGNIVNILREDDALTTAFLDQMTEYHVYLLGVTPQSRAEERDTSLMTEALTRKQNILFNENTDDFLDIFRLPYGWDLQRIALTKLKQTLLWTDVADFNDIANPLDEVEMFEGRIMALPRMADSKISVVGIT